jgi:hypothetical protein
MYGQAAAVRNFHRCIADLLKLQKHTPKPEIGFVSQNQPEAPALDLRAGKGYATSLLPNSPG